LEIRPSTAVIGKKKILFDAALFSEPPVDLFDPQQLAAKGLLTGGATGRGQAWFFRYHGRELVLRHCRRGGLVEKVLLDRYWGGKPENSRSWREWRLLLRLYREGLPVPRPVAANVHSGRFFYRADLITELIPGACSLADCLEAGPLAAESWHRIGAAIALFHHRGVWHPDLNARNILFDENGKVFLIDFDRGRLRSKGRWQQRNLERLLRSLRKIQRKIPGFFFNEADWPLLLEGYRHSNAKFRMQNTGKMP
jgi:3-deoxy-D-manno-octulosonic acid kinase